MYKTIRFIFFISNKRSEKCIANSYQHVDFKIYLVREGGEKITKISH